MQAASSGFGKAPEALARILDSAPPVVSDPLRGETTLTGRWGHGELHDHLPGMEGHVIITYYGQPQDIVWRVEGQRLAGQTRTGSITIIPEGHDGRWDIAGSIGVSHVFLSQERLQACAEDIAGGKTVDLLARVGFDDPLAGRVMEMLGREAAAPDPSARLFVEQATDLLCTQLVRGHSSFSALQGPAPRRGLADWQVRKVTDYMRAHLDAPVGLDELAALAGLSRFHFCTAFKAATGKSPHEQLVTLRIERARQLLLRPDLPVTEIALAVGYETPSAFAASFRKATGVTPSAFRQGV
ncbi:MAG TPA: AraC family transcriptional regulator [Phenylobacterium sp.]|uniref:AraC family transcriptional regulator n=1 Tax=Phenylobacterium sp. TaxID=1871053 RepID=UPI002F94302D